MNQSNPKGNKLHSPVFAQIPFILRYLNTEINKNANGISER